MSHPGISSEEFKRTYLLKVPKRTFCENVVCGKLVWTFSGLEKYCEACARHLELRGELPEALTRAPG